MPTCPYMETPVRRVRCVRNEPPVELLALSRAVLQLGPDRRDPEKFFLDKSEIAYRLKKLARELEAA
jgi:hypothetical protein